MTGKRFRVNDLVKYNYSEIGEYIDENHTDRPLMNNEVCDLLNELHDENQIKLEIVDAFIRGMEDEKGIDPENVEFQCKLNFTIKVLKKLKKDMLEPTEFKRLKELIE